LPRNLGAEALKQSLYNRCGKRVLDASLSLLGLIVLAPLFLICAVVIKFSSRGTVFFRQVRTGLEGEAFRLYKFRSMVCRPPGQESLLTASDDPRVTPVGSWLRKTKIDELPQLINVLLGQMSLVGPRPEVHRYTDKYTREQRRILSVRPGITGLASVAFASEEQLLAGQVDKERFYVTTLMPLKIELELEYCRDISLWGDLRILLQTLFAISGGPRPSAYPVENTPKPSQGAGGSAS
jgi:lipopolysaccharide/colanic/teichoic acid biosynthesis glycosyltransferase